MYINNNGEEFEIYKNNFEFFIKSYKFYIIKLIYALKGGVILSKFNDSIKNLIMNF